MTDDPIIAVVATSDEPANHRARAGRIVERTAMPLFVAAVLMALMFGAWFSFVRIEPFDPVSYSVQTVQSIGQNGEVIVPTIDGYERPALYVDDIVNTTGEVVVDADHPVEVVGNVVWVQVQPGGYSCVTQEMVPGMLDPGKEIRMFQNEIPACVVDRVNLSGPAMWKITGSVDVVERGGVVTTWTTEGFWIVPRLDG